MGSNSKHDNNHNTICLNKLGRFYNITMEKVKGYTTPLYFDSHQHQVSYLTLYKCASTSIKKAIDAGKKTTMPLYDVFTVIRNPIERAPSIYAENVLKNEHKGLSFTEWLQYIKEHSFYEQHQLPQIHYIDQHLDKINSITIYTSVRECMEDLDIPIGKLNQRRTEVKVTSQDIELIKDIWSDDLTIWHRCIINDTSIEWTNNLN